MTRKMFCYLQNLIIVLVMPIASFAQSPDEPGPSPAPFDGGLTLLLAAGIGYGVKKWRDSKKAKTHREDEHIL